MTEEEKARFPKRKATDRVEIKAYPPPTGFNNAHLIDSLRLVAKTLAHPLASSHTKHFGPWWRYRDRVEQANRRWGRLNPELSRQVDEVANFLVAPPRLWPEPRPDLAEVIERLIQLGMQAQFGG